MNILSFFALALAVTGALIPTFGIAFSVVGSLFAFFVYRSSPLIAGMAIGVSLANTAALTPGLLTMDVVMVSTMNEEALKNSHGFLYWGASIFHALIWVLAIMFRSHGLPERYEEALRREADLLREGGQYEEG